METPELRGRKVTVVGLARSGVAAARLCAREGARVTVTAAPSRAHSRAAATPLRASPTTVTFLPESSDPPTATSA